MYKSIEIQFPRVDHIIKQEGNKKKYNGCRENNEHNKNSLEMNNSMFDPTISGSPPNSFLENLKRRMTVYDGR